MENRIKRQYHQESCGTRHSDGRVTIQSCGGQLRYAGKVRRRAVAAANALEAGITVLAFGDGVPGDEWLAIYKCQDCKSRVAFDA